MSEYEGITGELREAVGLDRGMCYVREERFERLCDAIDAVHAGLEKENAALKERDGYIELPKDADGVPICVGDCVEYVDGPAKQRTVTSINLAGDGWWVYVNGVGRRPDKYRHASPDTWESIIADAMGCEPNEVAEDADLMKLVARCKALCERTNGGDAE